MVLTGRQEAVPPPAPPPGPTCQLPQPHVHVLSRAFAATLSTDHHLRGSDTELSGTSCPTWEMALNLAPRHQACVGRGWGPQHSLISRCGAESWPWRGRLPRPQGPLATCCWGSHVPALHIHLYFWRLGCTTQLLLTHVEARLPGAHEARVCTWHSADARSTHA